MTQQSTTRQEAPASIGIALLGAGVVGGGVAHSIGAHAAEYERRIGRRLELRQILVRNPEKVRGTSVDPGIVTTDFDQILSDPKIQIVVEVMGGEEPAYRYLCQTLESRRYAVTANKEVMAKHGPELLSLARRNGVDILFEASVGGGIPLIAPLKRDLIANEITSLRAIVNGTTNYILTRMSSEGIDFADALEQAQALGYAEADPTNDVEGIDAAYKLCILASLAFRTAVFPADVYHEGITRLRANDFRYARELGYAIKLLAIGRRLAGGSVEVRVHPVLLREDEPLSKVDGVFNAVELEGDLTGLVLFQGQGAGSFPTSSAVLADVIDIAREIGLGQSGRAMEPYSASQQIRPFEELESRHYLRLRVPDRAGVLSKICGVLGDQYGISISDIIQKETSQEDQSTEIVIMTHAAREASMRAALMELEQLPVVNEIGNFIRVETPR
jgi:homoserine dehydrogenase